MFISVIVFLLATILAVYLLCKHKKLFTSLVLHKVKQVLTQKEISSECRTLACIGIILTIISLAMVTFLHYRKSKFGRGCTFSNAVKIKVFISDVWNYIPIKLCKTAGGIHLFKITGTVKAENIKLNKNYIWDTLEIDWKEVTVTFSENKINLPRFVTIKLQDNIMLKQEIMWYTLATGTQEIV